MRDDNTKAAELAEKLNQAFGMAINAATNGQPDRLDIAVDSFNASLALLRASEGRVPEGLPEGIAERLRRSIAWLDKGELLPGPGGCISLPDIKALHALLTAAPHPPAQQEDGWALARSQDTSDYRWPEPKDEFAVAAQQAEPVSDMRYSELPGCEGLIIPCVDAAINLPVGTKLYAFSPPHKAEGAEPHAVAIYSVHSNKPYRVKAYEGPDSLSDDGGLGEHWGGTEPLYPTTQEPSA